VVTPLTSSCIFWFPPKVRGSSRLGGASTTLNRESVMVVGERKPCFKATTKRIHLCSCIKGQWFSILMLVNYHLRIATAAGGKGDYGPRAGLRHRPIRRRMLRKMMGISVAIATVNSIILAVVR
jgi:hypothetical protein